MGKRGECGTWEKWVYHKGMGEVCTCGWATYGVKESVFFLWEINNNKYLSACLPMGVHAYSHVHIVALQWSLPTYRVHTYTHTHSGVITSISQSEIWVKRSPDNSKLRIYLSHLTRGKYILKRRTA